MNITGMGMDHEHDDTLGHATRISTASRSRDHSHAGTTTAIHDQCGHDHARLMRIAELTALLHLASPALPIGAFSYSQGLEAAIEHGLIHDGDSARDWIASGLTHVLARGELPFLAHQIERWRAHDAAALASSPMKNSSRAANRRN